MLLDGETLDLAPRAAEVIGALGGDPRFKLEMPAAQLEIVTAPRPTVGEAARELARARADLEAAAAGFRVAGAGAHPFASGTGPLNTGERYEAIGAEYAAVANRQLVFGLHVHVAVRGAERALAVYNALRSHLPELAAARRQRAVLRGPGHRAGVGPLADLGAAPAPGGPARVRELRGLRGRAAVVRLRGPAPVVVGAAPAPDARDRRGARTRHAATVEDTAAVGAFVHALVKRLAARHDAGERMPAPRRGGSTRTAGRRAGTGSRVSCSTSSPASAAARASGSPRWRMSSASRCRPATAPRASARWRPSAAWAGWSHGWQTGSVGRAGSRATCSSRGRPAVPRCGGLSRWPLLRLRVGFAGRANCGWVGNWRCRPRGRSRAGRAGLVVDFHNGSGRSGRRSRRNRRRHRSRRPHPPLARFEARPDLWSIVDPRTGQNPLEIPTTRPPATGRTGDSTSPHPAAVRRTRRGARTNGPCAPFRAARRAEPGQHVGAVT